MHHLYIIRGDGNAHKIGITGNIDNRIKQLQTGNAQKLQLCMYTSNIDRKAILLLEKKLHKLFFDEHMNGEWFNVAELTIYRALLDEGLTVQPVCPAGYGMFGSGNRNLPFLYKVPEHIDSKECK